MNQYDYQTDQYDYLANISQGVGYAEVLGIAVNKDIFTAIGDGKTIAEIAPLWGFDEATSLLFVKTLTKMGLLGKNGDYIFNTPVAAKYLNSQSKNATVDSILTSMPSPVFLGEMLLPYFTGITWTGNGKNTLYGNEFNHIFTEGTKLSFEESEEYQCIIAGADYESQIQELTEDGFLIILGEFPELETLNSAMNALRRHLGGKPNPMPSVDEISEVLEKQHLFSTPLLPLSQESGCIIGAKSQEVLDTLTQTKEECLLALLKQDDIQSMKVIDVADVVAADWVADHCRWGCSSDGDKCCPPNSPTYKETETSLKTYKKAILIEGQPPTADFQKLMLHAEKTAFKAGYYKAFAYWAGPCSLCTECKKPDPPKKCTATRPSMESAGIDVFATVRKQGYSLETRKDKTEFVKYFGLLLLY